MIELGTTRATTVATRRITSALTGLVVIIVFIWLLGAVLHISPYSIYLLLTAIGMLFLARMLKIKLSNGAVRAVSSLFWNLFVFNVETIILIYFLGWIASLEKMSFPGQFYTLIPDFVLAAFVAGAIAFVTHQAAPPLEPVRSIGKPLLVSSGTNLRLDSAQLSTNTDGIALPMSLSKRTSGYVLYSDVEAMLDTPMGTKELKLRAPVVISGTPFKAKKASDDDVKKLTGKTSKDLIEDAKTNIGSVSANFGQETSVDLPLIHVKEDMAGSDVEVGPISVRSDNTGDHVNIGPFHIDHEEHRHGHSKPGEQQNRWGWFTYAKTGSFITSKNGVINAKWNGSSLSLKGAYMHLAVGGDSFEYDPHEIKTTSPLHTLRVTQSGISLETSRFAVNVYSSRVLVRTADGKTKSTESEQLASDLKEALTTLAMKQVKDLISGEPIDIEEMLRTTEGVLTQYA